jgi:hypothetical protein
VTEVRLLGGPLDGSKRPMRAAPASNFVWVDSSLRFFRDPRKGERLLYRFAHARKMVGGERVAYFLYAGHSYAPCCGAYVKIDREKPHCPLCEAALVAPQ